MTIIGNRLPKPIVGAAAVPFNNSFLLVGGDDSSDLGFLADIYQYNAAEDDWLKLETELKTPKYGHVALLVQPSLFPECP